MGYYPQESLYKPYKYHGYTVRGTPNCPLITTFYANQKQPLIKGASHSGCLDVIGVSESCQYCRSRGEGLFCELRVPFFDFANGFFVMIVM